MNAFFIQDTFNYLNRINSQISSAPILFNYNDANEITERIKMTSENVKKEFPYFSKRLSSLLNILFQNDFNGLYMNSYVFGQIYEIFLALSNINNFDFWSLIHPQIAKVSKKLYLDGHYANAAEDAFIEINVRVKGLFQIINPNDKAPDGDGAMTTVFSTNNPLVEFCDTSSDTGKNVQKGFMQMLAGAMSALRNPKAHENIMLSADDAMRRLMFASILMFKIDEAVAYSNIQEK